MPCVSEKWGVQYPPLQKVGGYAYPPPLLHPFTPTFYAYDCAVLQQIRQRMLLSAHGCYELLNLCPSLRNKSASNIAYVVDTMSTFDVEIEGLQEIHVLTRLQDVVQFVVRTTFVEQIDRSVEFGTNRRTCKFPVVRSRSDSAAKTVLNS